MKIMKRRPKTLICYLTLFLSCCIAAIIYYCLLFRSLPDKDHNFISTSNEPINSLLYSSNERSKEIKQKLTDLETGLKENGQVLDIVRKKVYQVSNAIYSQHSHEAQLDVHSNLNQCPNVVNYGK